MLSKCKFIYTAFGENYYHTHLTLVPFGDEKKYNYYIRNSKIHGVSSVFCTNLINGYDYVTQPKIVNILSTTDFVTIQCFYLFSIIFA